MLQDMRIKRYDERSSVDEVGPQTEIDGRAASDHPSQKHAYALAGGRAVFGYYAG